VIIEGGFGTFCPFAQVVINHVNQVEEEPGDIENDQRLEQRDRKSAEVTRLAGRLQNFHRYEQADQENKKFCRFLQTGKEAII